MQFLHHFPFFGCRGDAGGRPRARSRADTAGLRGLKPVICKASGVRQSGQAPLNETGQLGSGDGTGQLPANPQAGQCQRARLQQGHTVVQMAFIGAGPGLAPAWGGPAVGICWPSHLRLI